MTRRRRGILTRYERRHERLLPEHDFVRRQLASATIAGAMVLGSLLVGVLGYRYLCGFSWIDSLLNASMILGGMGPVDPIRTVGGKLFASAYALYSGVTLLTSVGVLMAPAFHRFLHHFHLEVKGEE